MTLESEFPQAGGPRADETLPTGYQPSPEDELLDLEARCLLVEPEEAKRNEGVEKLLQRYKKPLMGYLGEGFADLSEDERATVISKTFIEIYKMAVEGRLDVEKPLHGLVFTIAKWRAIDHRRWNSRRIRVDESPLEDIGQYLKETETGYDWNMARACGKVGEIEREFRNFVRGLKAKQQKRVATVMADALPGQLSDSEIADEVKRRFGIVISQVEVKGAKQAFRTKFREILKRKIQ